MKRGDTPTKLNFTNKKSHSSSMPTHTQRRTQMGSRFDENINEEDSLSMSRSMSRERSTEQLYNGNSNFKKQYSVSPGRNDLVSPRFNQDREQQREQRAQLSPRETFDEEEHRNYLLNYSILLIYVICFFRTSIGLGFKTDFIWPQSLFFFI